MRSKHIAIAMAALVASAACCILAVRPSSGRSAGGPISPNQSIANVREFGASATGVADDTAAVQRAVDSGRGKVYFPKGIYKLTRPVVIELDKVGYTSICGDGLARILMAGPGPAFKFVGTHYGTADPPTFKENVWLRQRMPSIDGIGIEGVHPAACGIEAEGTMQLTVSRVLIRHVQHGIHLVKNNRNVIITGCHIYDNTGVGIYYDDVNLHQSNIIGCHISYNGGGGIVSRAGNVRNIQISGCDLEANMAPAGPPTANVLIDCRGSRYGTAEVAITGCTIQHSHEAPDSANIRIVGSSGRTARLDRQGEGLVTIVGNVLSDVQVNIDLQDCRGVVVTANTGWRAYQWSLRVVHSSNVVVGPNNFGRRTPGLAYRGTVPRNALLLQGSKDCTLNGLHITQVWNAPAGLTLRDCERINITGCSILDCDHAGILPDRVRNSLISNCLIRNDSDRAKGFTPMIEQNCVNVSTTRPRLQ